MSFQDFYYIKLAINLRVNKTASINIDMDTLQEDPSINGKIPDNEKLKNITYEKVLPRFLKLIDKHNIKVTFFVIGKNIENNKSIIKKLSKKGHELANHTMNHPKQLVNLDKSVIKKEIEDCGNKIFEVTGQYPSGFRAPGYTITPTVIKILKELNYKYDSSLNTSLGYYLLKKCFKLFRLWDKEYITTQKFSDLNLPRLPYRMADNLLLKIDKSQNFLEIPITIIPYFNFPFTSSLLLGFGLSFSEFNLKLIRANSNFLNFELHINEFTKKNDIKDSYNNLYITRNFVNIDINKRLHYFNNLFTLIKKDYNIKLLKDVKI